MSLEVAGFWERASCGEVLLLRDESAEGYRAQMIARYRLEPYVPPFIEPSRWAGKKVLEIGVGLGADHQLLAEAGAELHGIDLTHRAIEHTRRRFAQLGLRSNLEQGSAERLPFPDDMFDLVYSYGVIHVTPDTPRAASEIMRVLRPGGTFKVMIYHRYSFLGLMLWLRYGALRLRSLSDVFVRHLESPGTKAYSVREAMSLFGGATDLTARVELTHADLLSSGAGQQHAGVILSLARRLWPRALIERFGRRWGLFLLIEGQKAKDPI